MLTRGFYIRRIAFGIVVVCMVIIGLLWISPDSEGQTTEPFTPDTSFSIEAYNGAIYFAANGTYAQARFENNSWVFNDLSLTDSPTVESFRVSTKNCNITIISFAGITTDPHIGALQYNVSGPGIQTFNFGRSPAFGLDPKGHVITVRFNLTQYPDFHPEGSGWYFAEDGTITITNATTEAYIFYFDYSDELTNDELPFYQNHSVMVVALVLVAAIVLIGVAVKAKAARSGGKP